MGSACLEVFRISFESPSRFVDVSKETTQERVIDIRQSAEQNEQQQRRIPIEYGGAGSSVQEVIRFIVDLAAIDSNITQALRPDFAIIESLLAGNSESECQRWFLRF